jgi:hypothetical protein
MARTYNRLQMGALLGAVRATQAKSSSTAVKRRHVAALVQSAHPLSLTSIACVPFRNVVMASALDAGAPARVCAGAGFSGRPHAHSCRPEQVRLERGMWGRRRQTPSMSRSLPNAADQMAGSTLLEHAASEFCGDGAAEHCSQKCHCANAVQLRPICVHCISAAWSTVILTTSVPGGAGQVLVRPAADGQQPAAPSRGNYHIHTMGCQMNLADSERMAGALEVWILLHQRQMTPLHYRSAAACSILDLGSCMHNMLSCVL